MKIAVACGGTGGHIFPGLATARVLRQRGHQVTLWLAGKDVERQAVKGWDGPVVTLQAEGLPRRLSLAMIRAVYRMLQARRTGRRLMARAAPDAVLAMGSYASVGPVLAARRLGIPYILHEANVVPGRAVSMLAARAAAVAISFEATRFYLRRVKLSETGFPLRSDLLDAARAMPPRPPDAEFTALIMGGSRGAHELNVLGAEAVCRAVQQGGRLRVIHLTGVKDADPIRQTYQAAGVNARVEPFVQDMASIYKEVDLVICRSGAASCAELCVFGLPSLLVPLPTAVRDHQMANAEAMDRVGAAQMVREEHLRADWLADYLLDGSKNRARLRTLGAAARKIGRLDAAEALAALIEETVEKHRAAS